MIRTLTFALRRDPDTSRAIGYHATQQNLAYNHAVDVLNREPNLPKRSGENHPDALNKRITAWRRPTGKKPKHPLVYRSRRPLQNWSSRAQRTSSGPTAAPRTTSLLAPGTAPTTRAVGDAAIKSASTSATSPASRVTASAASTPSPSNANEAAATSSDATKTSGSRSATSCWKPSPSSSPSRASTPSA